MAKVVSVVPQNDKIIYVVEMLSAQTTYYSYIPEDKPSVFVSSINYNNKTDKFVVTISDYINNTFTETLPINSNSSFEEVISYIKSNYYVQKKISLRENFRKKYPQLSNQKEYKF